MSEDKLGEFAARVTDARRITDADVRLLLSSVLEDGLISRSQAETLLALDRSLQVDASWADVVAALLVDYVVWGARPTGSITADDASWLTAALDLCGPSDTAMRIACEVVEEAQTSDQALLDYILKGRQHAQKTLAA